MQITKFPERLDGKSVFKVVLRQVNTFESDLQILECNNFRQICHIFLRLKKADDEKLKK